MFLQKVFSVHWGGALGDSHHPGIQRVAQALVPIVVGAVALVTRPVLASSVDMLSSVSIVTGLLFSLLAFLVQLRAQMRARNDPSTRNAKNVNYAFYSSVYACTVGFTLVVCISLQKLFADPLTTHHGNEKLASNWILYTLFAHFILTMWQCLRRLWRVYETEGLNQP